MCNLGHPVTRSAVGHPKYALFPSQTKSRHGKAERLEEEAAMREVVGLARDSRRPCAVSSGIRVWRPRPGCRRRRFHRLSRRYLRGHRF